MSKWHYSPCPDEIWYEGGDSKEEAISRGEEDYPDYGFYVAQCEKQDFVLCLTGQDILEELHGHNEDIDDEDNSFIWDSITKEQEKDLGDMVTAAIYEWVSKHQIDIQAHIFSDVHHQEFIPPKETR